MGRDSFNRSQIQKGLFAVITDVKIKDEIFLKRTAKKINDGFQLNIYLSNTKVSTTLNDKTITLGVNNKSIILSSATTSAELRFPVNLPIQIFHIYFSKEWLLQHAIDETSNLYEPVVLDQPVYIIEEIDYNFAKVKEFFDPQKSVSKIKMRSTIYQILEHVIAKLEKRGNLRLSRMNPKDIVNLANSCRAIENNFPDVMSNEHLAKLAGMSLSKFKRLFKQVYGIPPYQYHMNFKMNLALELLESQQYSVSQVGYAVGYQNLSQFTKAFFKYHHILPKNVS